MSSRFTATLTAIVLSLLSWNVAAEGLPDYYPASFDQTGILHAVSSGRFIEVNARRYALDSGARVHSTVTKFSSVRALTPGLEVGFNWKKNERGGYTVTEIWVLPEGSVLVP